MVGERPQRESARAELGGLSAELERDGDVYNYRVWFDGHLISSSRLAQPAECPACGHEVHRDANGWGTRCETDDCPCPDLPAREPRS